MYRNTVAISMAAPLQYLVVTVNVVALEKVSFSDTLNPKVFVHRLTVGEKQYLLNRGKLTQPIQVQLSKKQKASPQFFFAFLKSM